MELIKKFKETFFSYNFIIFVIIGVVNTFNGVWISYLLSLLFDANLSFVIGYIISLGIAYVLNSIFNFKQKLAFVRFIKFAVSYIPNFIIQNVVVIIIYNILGWHKLIAYALAAIIGIPVTFLILKLFAFNTGDKNTDNSFAEKITKKKLRLITGFVLIAIPAVAVCIFAGNLKSDFPAVYTFVIILTIVISVVMYMIIINSVLHFLTIEKIYLICGLIMGILYLFIIPPYAAPDEEIHIDSAYHFSNMLLSSTSEEEKGYLFAGSRLIDIPMATRACDIDKKDSDFSNDINKEAYEKYFESFSEKIESSDEPVIVPKRVSGPVILYCVSGTGMAAAKLLNMNYSMVIFMGGLFNVILFVICVYYSMKILPFGKRCLFAIAMFPITLQQTSSLSYDNMIISSSFVVTAIAINYAIRNKMKRSMFIIYAVSSFFLVLSKGGAYFMLVFLPFVLGFSRNRLKRRNIIAAAVIVLFVVLIMTRETYMGISYPGDAYAVGVSEQGGAYIKWAEEYAYGIKDYIYNPGILFSIIKNTVVNQFDFLLQSMIAKPLGWLNVMIPDTLCYAFLFMLFLGTVKYSDSKSIIIGIRDRIIIWAVCISTIAICAAAMLLYWTPRSYDEIQGLQGRYFLPILPVACLTLRNNYIVLRKNIDNIYIFALVFLQYLTAVHLFSI